ncbi:hypothetical protein D9M69_469220 [compost metagenome]
MLNLLLECLDGAVGDAGLVEGVLDGASQVVLELRRQLGHLLLDIPDTRADVLLAAARGGQLGSRLASLGIEVGEVLVDLVVTGVPERGNRVRLVVRNLRDLIDRQRHVCAP